MCQRVLARAFCLLFPFCDCLQEDIINLVIYKVQKLAAMLESEGFMYVYVVRGRLFKKEERKEWAQLLSFIHSGTLCSDEYSILFVKSIKYSVRRGTRVFCRVRIITCVGRHVVAC